MKTNQRKNFFFGIVVLMFFSFQTYGQDSWTLLKEESNVQVYYMTVACGSMEDLDPLNIAAVDDSHETFKLKFINNNASSVPVTFSKITKVDDSDEINLITVPPGTTLLETCEAAPKLILTKQQGDQYPIAVSDFLNDFKITIQD